jgi:hypothetical protein
MSLLAATTAIGYAEPDLTKDERIQREMACIQSQLSGDRSLDWGDLCSGSDWSPTEPSHIEGFKKSEYGDVVRYQRDGVTHQQISKKKSNKERWDELWPDYHDTERFERGVPDSSENFLKDIFSGGESESAEPDNPNKRKWEDPALIEPKHHVPEHRATASMDLAELDEFEDWQGYGSDVDATPPQMGQSIDSYALTDHPAFQRHTWDVGIEAYDFAYEEPTLGVEDDGEFFGAYLEYTFRRNANPYRRQVASVLETSEVFNVIKLEGRLARGEVDYTGSGTWSGIVDWNHEIRGLIGQEFYAGTKYRFTPYIGLGTRYLHDAFSAVPARTVDGQPFFSGYDRESRYWYVPLGITLESIEETWSMALTIEYNWYLQGTQTSHLQDQKTIAGANAGFEKIENDQDEGYGFRTSLELVKYTEHLNYVFEPFFRYWSIEDSEIKNVIRNGSVYGSGLEPENETIELGARLGLRF